MSTGNVVRRRRLAAAVGIALFPLAFAPLHAAPQGKFPQQRFEAVDPLQDAVRPARAAPQAEAADEGAEKADPQAELGLWPYCPPSGGKLGDDSLGHYDLGDGKLSLLPVDGTALDNCLKATGVNLRIQLGGALVPLHPGPGTPAESPLSFGLQSKQFSLFTGTPMLCDSYYTATDSLSLLIADGNHHVRTAPIAGIESMQLALSDFIFTPTLKPFSAQVAAPALSCFVVNATSLPTASASFFESGFEPLPTGTNVVIEVLDAQTDAPMNATTKTVAIAFPYKLRVTNRGTVTANNVRIREYLPGRAPNAAPLLQPASTNACLLNGQPCEAPPAGDPGLLASFATLAVNAPQIITLSRLSPAVGTGSALAGFAAFVSPATPDIDLSNNLATLAVTVVTNAVPVATPASASTDEDSAGVAITLAGTDADEADQPDLVFAVATQPASGVLTGNAPNLTYTPNANFNGTDSFTFTATDSNSATSAPATVTITVNAVNDAPVASGTIEPATAAEGAAITAIQTAARFDDPDTVVGNNASPQTLVYSLSSTAITPEGGSAPAALSGISINSATGEISGTPDFDAASVDRAYDLTVTATEAGTGIATPALSAELSFRLSVTNTNRAPVIAAALAAQSFDETVVLGSTNAIATAQGFSDPDAQVLSFTACLRASESVCNPTLPGQLVIDASTGLITGALPQVSSTSTYAIEVTASDGAASVSQGFQLTVNPVNAAPSFTLSFPHIVVYRDGSTPRKQDEAFDAAFSASRRTNCSSSTDGSCTVTINGLVTGVLANDAGEQVRLLSGTLSSCTTTAMMAVGDAFADPGFPPESPAADYVADGSSLPVMFTYFKSVPIDTQFECLLRLEDNGNPAPATSEDIPAHRLIIRFRDTPPAG